MPFALPQRPSNDGDRERNLQLLKERSWLDIPVVYTNNRRAIIALEKGTPGERAFAEAFKAWEQTSADLARPPDASSDALATGGFEVTAEAVGFAGGCKWSDHGAVEHAFGAEIGAAQHAANDGHGNRAEGADGFVRVVVLAGAEEGVVQLLQVVVGCHGYFSSISTTRNRVPDPTSSSPAP